MGSAKIMLVFPNFQQFEIFTATPHQPSLSLGYLAGILDQNHIDFKVVDAEATKCNIGDLLLEIEKYNPDYIGLTLNIAIAYAAIVHSVEIKKAFPKIKILMGGPWATAEDQYLLEKKFADIVIIGEGEETILELLKSNEIEETQLKMIQGISFLIGKDYFCTGKRNLISDLDKIPFPKWESFPNKGYRKSSRDTPMYPLLTSRGCPFDCLNCTKIIHGYKLRYRSIENIIAELRYLKEIGAKEIIIEDDMFNFDLNRMKKMLMAIIKADLGLKFQLSNGIRADRIDKLFAELLYAAGFYRAAIAIESGSQKVLKFLNKQLDLKVVPKAIKILKEAHIVVSGYFIIGLPLETYQSMIYTVQFANNIELDIIVFLNLLIFPSTKLCLYLQSSDAIIYQPKKIDPYMNYISTPISFCTSKLNQKIIQKVLLYNFIRSFINPKRFFHIAASYTVKEIIDQAMIHLRISLNRLLKVIYRFIL